jgi:hypothetical protein
MNLKSAFRMACRSLSKLLAAAGIDTGGAGVGAAEFMIR